VSVGVLRAWTCNAWPCVGVRPHSECCTLGKHPRACVCRIQQPEPYPSSRAFPARSAHRPGCIKPADLADRWARGRVDTHDENRALRALSTHIKTSCDLETCPDGVFPLARRSARSQSRHPTTRQSGCVGPYLALWTPLMSTYKRDLNVGSGLPVELSWEARHGAAAGLVWRCRIWTIGEDFPGTERGNSMP
jgi:hypothetical protein